MHIDGADVLTASWAILLPLKYPAYTLINAGDKEMAIFLHLLPVRVKYVIVLVHRNRFTVKRNCLRKVSSLTS